MDGVNEWAWQCAFMRTLARGNGWWDGGMVGWWMTGWWINYFYWTIYARQEEV